MRVQFIASVVALLMAGVPVSTATQTIIHVDSNAATGGNGSDQLPYKNLPEAVAAARVVPGEIVIKVEPGDYALAAPLVIDVPLQLRGSTEQVEGADSWPTGEAVAGTATRIFSTTPSGSNHLIQVGRTDGTVLSGIRISGFVFEGTANGIEVLLTRVQGYWVADNIFRAPATFGLQSIASSGRVTGNHFSGVGTGAIFAGGYPASPSEAVFDGNRSIRNNLGGVLLNGASINIPELGDELKATIRGNDLSENVGNPTQSFGLRVFILRRDLGAPGDSQSSSRIHALVQGNRIANNRIGISLDAGFPYRRVGIVCDTRVYSGTVDLELAGNALTGSLITPALVTFTRNMAALDQSLLPLWQYLHGATFTIRDRDGSLAGATIDHPQTDRFVGPCPGDATHELLGNALIYNGDTLLKN